MTVTFLFACNAEKKFKRSIKEDDIQVPVGFGKKEGTLLVVMTGKKGFDRWYKRNFLENYKGKYMLLDKGEDHDPQYKDVKTYPYVLGQDMIMNIRQEHVQYGNGLGSTENTHSLTERFFIMDRQTKVIYSTKKKIAVSNKGMRAYVQALEEIRAKNAVKNSN